MFKSPFKRKLKADLSHVPPAQESDSYVKFFDDFLAAAENNFLKNFEIKKETKKCLNSYKRERTVGIGSFGRVLLVREIGENKTFALKILERKTSTIGASWSYNK